MIRRAFTLIELLIVVAIIALLVAILVPSLEQAKDRAKTVICLSNQHQIFLAYAYYAQNYDDYVSPSYDYAAVLREEPGETGGRSWAYKLGEFIPSIMSDPAAGILYADEPPPKRRTIVHCPAVAPHGGSVLREVNPEVYGNCREDYAANVLRSGRAHLPEYARGGRTNFYTLQIKSLRWDELGWSQVYIGKPSETFLLADGHYLDIEPGYYLDGGAHSIIFRHGGRRTANMLFFDGHAEEMTYPVGINTYPANSPFSGNMPLERPW